MKFLITEHKNTVTGLANGSIICRLPATQRTITYKTHYGKDKKRYFLKIPGTIYHFSYIQDTANGYPFSIVGNPHAYFVRDNEKLHQETELCPISLPNVWTSGEVCLYGNHTSSEEYIWSNTQPQLMKNFIDRFWQSDFNNDLTAAVPLDENLWANDGRAEQRQKIDSLTINFLNNWAKACREPDWNWFDDVYGDRHYGGRRQTVLRNLNHAFSFTNETYLLKDTGEMITGDFYDLVNKL